MKRHPALVPLSHDHHHALVQARRLHRAAARGASERREAAAAFLAFFARATRRHFRDEEERPVPLLEQVATPAALRRLGETPGASAPVELLAPEGKGPLWGAATEALNATLLAWPADAGPPEHVNDERDVLLVVLAGSATVTVDGEPSLVEAGQAIVIEKGRRRRIAAGPEGGRYLSVHIRRPPLQIARASAP